MFANFDWIGTILRSPVSLVLIGCSVVTLGVAIERFVYYWKRRGDPNATLALMLQRIREGKVQEAAFVCRSCQHPFGAVAAPLFEGGNESASGTAMEERMLIALSEQKLALERGLAILGTMAAAGPLIGLLGTVWGIMMAFHDMAATGSGSPSVVAGGVAEALTATGMGLIVAVPAVILYNHFARRMSVMLTVAENHARTAHAAMTESRSSVASRQAA